MKALGTILVRMSMGSTLREVRLGKIIKVRAAKKIKQFVFHAVTLLEER